MDGKEHQERVRASRLASLKNTPAWDELTTLLKEQEEKYWTAHRKQVARGKYPDPLDLARDMGKLDGIRALLRAPERAVSILERHNSEETS
jgi:hypothetical protein